MKKGYLIIAAITVFLFTGCTLKYTSITVNQEATKSGNTIDFGGADIKTETDQKADGQLDSTVDASAI